MALSYELAKQLKDAGFPQVKRKGYYLASHSTTEWEDPVGDDVYAPTLSELIEATATTNRTFKLRKHADGEWIATIDWDIPTTMATASGPTPEEAVAKLYLALHTITNSKEEV